MALLRDILLMLSHHIRRAWIDIVLVSVLDIARVLAIVRVRDRVVLLLLLLLLWCALVFSLLSLFCFMLMYACV